jgi:2-dehydro-3-deoxyphosphogluconate aldolase/(4S)-4-hydroxy-2-oxoglutarate aldolase
VAPNTSAEVIELGSAAGIPTYPGALTPTEIRQAQLLGAAAVKVFPVQALGGPRYVSELRGPYPDIPFMVSGGVTAATAPDYFAAGASMVCLGRELADPVEVAARDVDAIARRSRAVLERIAAA